MGHARRGLGPLLGRLGRASWELWELWTPNGSRGSVEQAREPSAEGHGGARRVCARTVPYRAYRVTGYRDITIKYVRFRTLGRNGERNPPDIFVSDLSIYFY